MESKAGFLLLLPRLTYLLLSPEFAYLMEPEKGLITQVFKSYTVLQRGRCPSELSQLDPESYSSPR